MFIIDRIRGDIRVVGIRAPELYEYEGQYDLFLKIVREFKDRMQ